ncbi:hypothetical protein [Zoogloea sp.]|jgi:hypothetical protein|uniref:hypothetical protein n=1 Tax=Zoogloea sp. TaxID=49181 RepID=UPI001DC387F2|nr:hypothetical protein [Zoogloea sp.]MBK6655835.1 hypothetical protein [Zoogloea sp.]
MTDDLSWNSALCVAGINLTKEERAAGWPAAFTPQNLARLQYPWGGSALKKKAANENQSLLIATISKAIQNGGLPAVARTRTEDITESRQVPDFRAPSSPYSGGLGSSYWLNRDQAPTMRTVTKKIGERTVSYFVIERAAFRAWLTKQGVEPSEHVQAWFDTMQPAQKLARGAKRTTKNDVFLELLGQIEEAWKASGRVPLDRNEWPGQSQDLCDLAGRLFPEAFGNMKPESFYRNYPKKAGLRFSASKGVREIYAELFLKDGAPDGQKFAA